MNQDSKNDKKEEQKKVIALVGGTLIDCTGDDPVDNTTIIIESKKIVNVGSSNEITIPENAEKLDVSGKFVLPGFIDLHIHTTYPRSEKQGLTDTQSLSTLRALQLMNQYLRSGVTCVRDAGSAVEPMQALVQADALGYTNTIRLVPCGHLITVTAGHGDSPTSSIGVTVDGPWAFRQMVRNMYRAGFRHIKLSPHYTFEEVQAAVDEAKTLGIPVTSHGGGGSDTHPPRMTRLAVEAGVDCIEHLNPMPEDVLVLMAEKGTYNVPTLAIYRELYKTNYISDHLITKRGWNQSIHEELFKKAHELKIVMGIGTDAIYEYMELYPGLYFTEMKYFVELGATPMEALMAATKNGAKILQMEDELGTIEEGKLADIQVLPENPLESFDKLGKPEIVIIDGTVNKFD